MAASLNTMLFLFFCLLQSASAEPPIKEVTVHHGDDATLSCEAPNNVNIAIVEWTRPDHNRSNPDKHVYLKIDGRLNTADQDPSYVNRVQLKDDEMKNGELSLILKNVNNNDEGAYVCRYKERGERWERPCQIKLIILNVEDGDSKGGKHSEDGKDKHQHLGVILSVTLIALVVSGLVGFVIYKNLKGRSEKKPVLPVHDPDVLQQLQENENSQKNITNNISDTQV